MGDRRLWGTAVGFLALLGCWGGNDDHTTAPSPMYASPDAGEGARMVEERVMDADPSPARAPRARKSSSRGGYGKGAAVGAPMAASLATVKTAPGAPPEAQAAAAEEKKVRSWFPDAFVWEPVIETNDDGVAMVPVRVPDTLTDWRLLGLAHDRTGQQAGALTGFASRLPVSASPRLPSFLYVGDVLQMPVRAVNGTDAGLSVAIGVEATGALSGGGSKQRTLGARGVVVEKMALTASKRGAATVRTQVTGGGYTDRAERSVRVTPTGRPVESSLRGTLAAETELTLPELAGIAGEETLDVVVFPGPQALVQAEVDRLSGGARPALPGSALQAIDHLVTLSERTGVTLNERPLRRLKLLAWQQLARRVHSASWLDSVGLLRGVSSRDLVGAVESARPGLVRKVAEAQKPDGTWSSESRSTVQRMLVQTATAAMVLPERMRSARLKAEGAVERQVPNIKDPYTAAVLLGSGVLHGDVAEAARTLVRESLVRDEQGTPRVEVPAYVFDAWGDRPSTSAMLAWTVLALVDDPEAAADRGTLAAELIGSWSGGRGFGAGRADPIALLAVVKAVPGASGPTTVNLLHDGKVVSSGTVDPKQPGVPLILSSSSGSATVQLDPPVQGLAFTATRRGYAPWPEPKGIEGFEWEWTDASLVAGESTELGLRLAAPAGTVVTVEVGLPAGMKVDAAGLRNNATLAWSEVLEDRVRMRTRGLPAVAPVIPLVVTPTFSGTFNSLPVQFDVAGQGAMVLPGRVWTVN